MRRSTEPSDSLEEGELDIDDRISRRTSNPNAIPVAPRQFRAGRETVSPSQRRAGLGFRSERRSPRPLASQESAFNSQPAFIDRRRSSGSGSAPRSTQASRQNTPSPRRHTPLVESPETEEIRITDSQAPSGDEGERTANAPAASTSELPRRHLETRLSDIDREIAECQEKLVMISSTSSKAPAAAPASQQRGSNDRAVPASPPIKASGSGAKAGESGVEIIDGSSRGEGGGSGAQADAGGEKDEPEHAASVVPQVVSDKTKAAFSGGHASDGSGDEAESGEGDAGGFGLDSSSDVDDSDGDSSRRRGRHRKDSMRAIINDVYSENQRKAAEVQASMAAPFLTAFPSFVPGSYPSPSDWPFWAENQRVHEKLKPFLVQILGKEKAKRTAHARQLQEQYADLYAKWRKRVEKLDRQREAKHRAGSGGGTKPGAAGSAGSSSTNLSSANSGSGTQFGSTFHRRRHGSGPSNPAVDEFGFSTGPLFTASATLATAHEGVGRADELFTSDAVHSEAELQAIIERLQYDDARNPDFRSQRTAATIPDMVVGEKERALLRFNNNSHRIDDPVGFYHVQMAEPGSAEYRRVAYGNNGDTDHYWTQAEVSAFVAAYLAHPKQFGKIASYIPHKSMNDCVLFYYRNKKPLRLKALEAKSSKRARRSRQASSSGGRKRKERAKERRERRAREEREKMAMEAAAECAPNDATPTQLDDASASHARSSALPSDDDTTAADACDILEQRTRSNALLRSIIAANRQRKAVTSPIARPLDARASLGITAQTVAERPPSVGDADDDAASASGREQPAPSSPASPVQPQPRPQVSDEPMSLPLSDPAQQQQQQLMEVDEDAEELEEMDDEEEGELVEDSHWEPHRPRANRAKSQHRLSELNAYAMGGSIVRTRRARELDDDPPSPASDDDEDSALYMRTTTASAPADAGDAAVEEEEIIEASGIVADRSQPALATPQAPPRVISRKSSSRFGATLTTIVDSSAAPVTDSAKRADVRPRSLSPVPSSAELSPPKESALDRFVTEEPSVLQRAISSYETLLMCGSGSPAGNTLAEAKATSMAERVPSMNFVAAHRATSGQASASAPLLDALVEELAGAEDKVLVGAAVWGRDDRRRVLRAFHKFAIDFAQVASLMPTKTMAQCRYFYYHYRTPGGKMVSEIIPITAESAAGAA
ncbi:DNA-binding protein snt1, partial [Linderina pennispora]